MSHNAHNKTPKLILTVELSSIHKKTLQSAETQHVKELFFVCFLVIAMFYVYNYLHTVSWCTGHLTSACEFKTFIKVWLLANAHQANLKM